MKTILQLTAALLMATGFATAQAISLQVSGAAAFALTTEMAANDAVHNDMFDGALIAVKAVAHTPAEQELVLALETFASAHRQHLTAYGFGREGSKSDYYEYLKMTGQPLPKCGKKQPNCHATDAADIAKEDATHAAAYITVKADMAFAQQWLANIQNLNAAQPVK